MAEDFLTELGETLTKTAKDITEKADSFFESQKTRTKITSEQRMIDKVMTDIGNMIYKRYVDGEAVDEELLPLCEEITQRKVAIANYRESMAKMKGYKVCASCGTNVPKDAAFCMQCGAPCPKEEEPAPVQPAASEEEIRQEAEEAEVEQALDKENADTADVTDTADAVDEAAGESQE